MPIYCNKKFIMALAVLAVAMIGVFAPLEGCRKYLSRRFMFLLLALCLLTGFGMAQQAQAVREFKIPLDYSR